MNDVIKCERLLMLRKRTQKRRKNQIGIARIDFDYKELYRPFILIELIPRRKMK